LKNNKVDASAKATRGGMEQLYTMTEKWPTKNSRRGVLETTHHLLTVSTGTIGGGTTSKCQWDHSLNL